ncbi:hypothetical protein O181_008700 [Austropuccinia psidii MF-1]|uniref:Rab-GAP TBC domain-containing protein n=1 Tax=Austropuccinia psidii MF-1 TaxID=1389203 RepID=A0A9Q3GJ54_9BASI|nr:hypothetical protein [Austropuccinia psidii MF-1]
MTSSNNKSQNQSQSQNLNHQSQNLNHQSQNLNPNNPTIDLEDHQVINDIETWNDVSDDESFNQKISKPNHSTIKLKSSSSQLNSIKSNSKSNFSSSSINLNQAIDSNPSYFKTQKFSLKSKSFNHQNQDHQHLKSFQELNQLIPINQNQHQDQSHPIQSSNEDQIQSCKNLNINDQIFDLIRDPAHVITQLKTEQTLLSSSSLITKSSQLTTNSIANTLPWEAVMPTEIINPSTSKTKQYQAPQSSTTDLHNLSPHQSPSTPPISSSTNYQALPNTPSQISKEKKKENKFIECFETNTIDVSALRKLSWSGIPNKLRALVWKILLGYLPLPESQRVPVLSRKRQEYLDAVRLAFLKGPQSLDQSIWHQINIDVARTNPGVSLWQLPATQRSLERILYVWAIRHPASGYVQGINDLVTPFFQVFLTAYIETDPETFDISKLPKEALDAVEADSFWSLSKLLDGIQDNYIFAQPGIQRQVARMKELCERVDAPLHKHLEDEKVEFIQFAFRWINCLLMRELCTKKIIRMWDTYLAEGPASFSEFHLYVCLAFLVRHSEKLRSMDFQSIIIFLQALPTQDWTEKDLELLLSQAFMWHSLFQGATVSACTNKEVRFQFCERCGTYASLVRVRRQ